MTNLKKEQENIISPNFFYKYWMFIIAGLTFVIYFNCTNHFLYFQGGDNADYLSLARSIAHGDGYTSINTYPHVPHIKYPFLFPLMLSSIIMVFGENILLMKAMIVTYAAITAFITALLFRSRDNEFVVFSTVLLVSTIPFTLTYSQRLLSEIPFTTFVYLTLYFAEKSLNGKFFKAAPVIISAIFLVCSYFIRSIGITLAVALIIAALLNPPIRKRIKTNGLIAFIWAFIFFVAAGSWYLRNYLVTEDHSNSYFEEFFVKIPNSSISPMINVSDVSERIYVNCHYYLKQLGMILWPFSSNMNMESMFTLGAIIAILTVAGFIAVVRNHRGPTEIFFLAYVSLILVWGHFENRFLIPLFPIIVCYIIKGIEEIISLAGHFCKFSEKKYGKFLSRAILCFIISTIFISNMTANIVFVEKAIQIRNVRGFEINPYFHVVAMNERMARMLNLCVFLRHNAEQNGVILCRKPRLVSLVSGRPAIGGPFDPDPDKFVEHMKKNKISYLIVDEVHEESHEYFIPPIKYHPNCFRLVYRIPETYSMVYQFLPLCELHKTD